MSELEDDFLDDLGFEQAPKKGPNESFLDYLNSPPHPRIGNLVFWLKHEMAKFQFTCEYYSTHKEVTVSTPKGPTKTWKDITKEDYARISIEYYLLMTYLPRFRRVDERPLCDMSTVLDSIMKVEEIKHVIKKNY